MASERTRLEVMAQEWTDNTEQKTVWGCDQCFKRGCIKGALAFAEAFKAFCQAKIAAEKSPDTVSMEVLAHEEALQIMRRFLSHLNQPGEEDENT